MLPNVPERIDQPKLNPETVWSILGCDQAMIEPLARGVDPVQLAFQSLVSMGTRTQRTASPLAVALDRLGVDLARGQSFTTAEAKQFVGLVQATLEVFATAAPTAEPSQLAGTMPQPAAPAQGTGVLLETAQLAMRDLQRALTQVLTEQRQVTTSLAPILRELLVAVQVETLAPEPRMPVPAGLLPLLEHPGGADVHAPSPTLARLVSSLVDSIARLQAVLPQNAVSRAERQAAPDHPGAAAAAEHASATVALPPVTTRLLQTLVHALAELVTLLPLPDRSVPVGQPSPAQPLENLSRALGEAVVLLREVLPAAAAPVPTDRALPERVPGPTPSATAPTIATPGTAVAQVIRLVHELLIANPAAATDSPIVRPVAELPAPLSASQAEASPSIAPRPSATAASPAAGLAELPTPVAVSASQIPPSLVASLVAVVANLSAALPPGVTKGAADTLLAELESATVINPSLAGTGVPLTALATVDAYRWGLLVGLNYRPALGRPAQARLSKSRPRCETCSRLLVQTRSGALVCPSC